MRRIHSADGGHWLAGAPVIAALLAVQLGVGGLTVIRQAGGGHPGQNVSKLALAPSTASAPAVAPPSRPTAVSPRPHATRTPSATPKAGVRRRTRSAPSSTHRTTSAVSSRHGSEGGYGVPPPGSVIAPYRAGQTSWEVDRDGVYITLSVDATPRAGHASGWHVTASMPGHYCCAITLMYGDGLQDAANTSSACPDPAAKPTSADAEFTHSYNRQGKHEFYLQVSPRGCSEGEEPSAHLFGFVNVANGPATSNGPALPALEPQSVPPGQPDSHTGDKSWIAVQVLAIDNDGYITNWTIDFGDGSALVHLAAGAGKCVDGPDGWPQNNSASIGQGADWPTLNHHFSTTGQYTVTYTAYSAGCDGRDVQSGSVHYSYYVP